MVGAQGGRGGGVRSLNSHEIIKTKLVKALKSLSKTEPKKKERRKKQGKKKEKLTTLERGGDGGRRRRC